MTATAFKVLGAVLLLVGILGLIANPVVGESGIFMTNMNHDVVHVASGIVLLAVGFAFPGAAMIVALIFGIVYLLVAILGLAMGSPVLGLIDSNLNDHILHVVLAIVFFALAFMGHKKSAGMSPLPM